MRFEPSSALVAERDGLADLFHIVREATRVLRPGGWVFLEHGWRQGEAVRAELERQGFTAVETRQDLGGQERVSLGRWRADPR